MARLPEKSTSSGSTGGTRGTVFNLLVVIHAFAGEERGIGFTP
jgi:hypothetical protein